MDAADFYTGLVAELYHRLKAHSLDAAPYRSLIERWGEPALELGCGDGEPLLDLQAVTLDSDLLAPGSERCEKARVVPAEEEGSGTPRGGGRRPLLDAPSA